MTPLCILYGRFNLIHPGLFSSLSIFSQLEDHLTRDFVELNSMGRDIQEIIGDVLSLAFKKGLKDKIVFLQMMSSALTSLRILTMTKRPRSRSSSPKGSNTK